MKKKKQNYSQLHYEQELAAQKRRSKKHPEPVPEIIPGKAILIHGLNLILAEKKYI